MWGKVCHGVELSRKSLKGGRIAHGFDPSLKKCLRPSLILLHKILMAAR